MRDGSQIIEPHHIMSHRLIRNGFFHSRCRDFNDSESWMERTPVHPFHSSEAPHSKNYQRRAALHPTKKNETPTKDKPR
jgi:hypothetical protein